MTVATKTYLKDAVHHHRAASKTGLLERLFTLWFRGFIYNQIWEDPRVDAEAMQLDGDSRILTISSGGCNVLNYLKHEPAKIAAIDLNNCHMALTRLKLAGLQHLPTYEDFYLFFGLANDRRNFENYRAHLRDKLDDNTLRFWERSAWPSGRLGRKRIKYFTRGFYNYSKLGLLIRFAHVVAKVTRKDPTQLLRAESIDEQQAFFDRTVAPYFENRFVKWMTRTPMTIFSLGIPPSQYRVMKAESRGQIAEMCRDRVYKLACGFPMHDNYFAWQAFGRTYDHGGQRAMPDYLRRENYDALRRNVDRVETHIQTLHEYLAAQEPGEINRFVLLDSQDWMPPAVIEALWEQIARVGPAGSRVIFRTAGAASPIESALPGSLLSRFQYDAELSKRLHEKDRSAIYGGFHVYEKTA